MVSGAVPPGAGEIEVEIGQARSGDQLLNAHLLAIGVDGGRAGQRHIDAHRPAGLERSAREVEDAAHVIGVIRLYELRDLQQPAAKVICPGYATSPSVSWWTMLLPPDWLKMLGQLLPALSAATYSCPADNKAGPAVLLRL